MITIYGPARSSGGRCFWLLEELGLAYENKPVDLMKKENRDEWFLKINPNGKVPALTDNGFTVFESMAINNYLCDKYRPDFLGKTPEERAVTSQWSFWAATELQGPLIQVFIQKLFVPEGRKDLKAIAENEAMIPGLLSVLENSLSERKYLNGNEFTLADLNLASVVSITHPIGFDMKPYNNINNWLRAISERPSFRKYMELRSK